MPCCNAKNLAPSWYCCSSTSTSCRTFERKLSGKLAAAVADAAAVDGAARLGGDAVFILLEGEDIEELSVVEVRELRRRFDVGSDTTGSGCDIVSRFDSSAFGTDEGVSSRSLAVGPDALITSTTLIGSLMCIRQTFMPRKRPFRSDGDEEGAKDAISTLCSLIWLYRCR